MTNLPIIHVDMDDVLADYSVAHAASLTKCPETRFP